jgi:methyltransferase (TIGR00027 family)
MGRALAHARKRLPGFDDPCALALLPEPYKTLIERKLRGEWPRSGREAAMSFGAEMMERLIGPRTVVIDEALCEAPRRRQVVIVGAGLDARAYRLGELSESVVFELDHPATQRAKRERTARLVPLARDLRHVAVDLTREPLDEALARAGHDSAAPTSWLIEGVITYLHPREVEATMAAMAARSAPGSRWIATYNEPVPIRGVFRRAFAGIGPWSNEPARASFSRAEMRALLARHRFRVASDRDGLERVTHIGVPASFVDRYIVRFHHVLVADGPQP